jgi:hypothetical protein
MAVLVSGVVWAGGARAGSSHATGLHSLASSTGALATPTATIVPARFDPSRLVTRGPGTGRPVLGQRVIEDDRKRPEPDEDDEDEPREPVPPEEMGVETAEAKSKSPVKAMLLSAAVPGVGQLYAGSSTGYAFLGVEAASWVTWGSFRSSSSNKEDEMFAYADDNFSMDLFDDNCVGQSGQSCNDASEQLRYFWENDKPEYYEIISKNTIYKSGWGLVVYENSEPPQEGTEAYREWIANFAAAQDIDFVNYNELRDERNDLSRTARGMTVVMLLNRLASAWHAFAITGGLNAKVKGDMVLGVDVKPSFSNPGAKVTLSRSFY